MTHDINGNRVFKFDRLNAHRAELIASAARDANGSGKVIFAVGKTDPITFMLSYNYRNYHTGLHLLLDPSNSSGESHRIAWHSGNTRAVEIDVDYPAAIRKILPNLFALFGI